MEMSQVGFSAHYSSQQVRSAAPRLCTEEPFTEFWGVFFPTLELADVDAAA